MSAESNQPEVGVLTSKVVQINAVQVGEGHENYTDRFVVLYAVCEDGSVWQRTQLLVDNRQFHPDGPWRMVQPPIEAVRQAIWAGNEIFEAEQQQKQPPCPFEVGDVIMFSNLKGTDYNSEWRVRKVFDDCLIMTQEGFDSSVRLSRGHWPNYKLVRKGG
jgi:hypothetical protein